MLDRLIDWGVRVVFGLPGDGINGLMEALRTRQEQITFIQVRHEEAAAFMACGYAKYTGRLGVCLATSGPGAIHLLNGLYDAKLDHAPVLAITGQTYHDLIGTQYQQEVDLLSLFKDVALYNQMVLGAGHVEALVDAGCRAALSDRGVAHLTIPVDFQEQEVGEKSSKKVAGHTTSVWRPPVVVPFLAPQTRRLRDTRRLREELTRLADRVDAIVPVPRDERAVLVNVSVELAEEVECSCRVGGVAKVLRGRRT